mmetsp:Transcript_29965/g.96068  ORF Transcript_29965/g.96068 Transcript_29965/m.96068 type:complete len:190 (-) Transcript_29965:103-672(-)
MSGHHHEGFIRTTSSGSNQSHAGSARRNSGIIASVYKNDEPVHHNHPPAAETFTRVPTDPGSGVRRTSSSGWNLPPEQEAIFERLSSVKDEMKGTIQETQRIRQSMGATLSEYFKKLLHLHPTEFDEELKRKFDYFDKDKNLYLDRQELCCAMSELSERPSEEEIDTFLSEFDVDGDGKVDFVIVICEN